MDAAATGWGGFLMHPAYAAILSCLLAAIRAACRQPVLP